VVLVQTGRDRAMMTECNPLVQVETLFKGRHFDRTDHHPVCQLVVRSKNSCGIAVILQQPAEPLSTAHRTSGLVLSDFPGWKQQYLAFPLMVPLGMIMGNEIG
jgi:hypothetical protein